MTDLTMTTRFDEHALAELPEVAGFTGELRLRALREFAAMPIPSQETEEWRYTDLSDLDLDFVPFSPGGGPEAVNRHGVLAAAGVSGERAGLQIQRNSEVISTQLVAGLSERGVIFGDLDAAAATHPDLVETHLHALVPTSRTKFVALHGAFRTGGTFLYVPDGVQLELPLQTLTYLDAEGAAIFPHTLIVVGADASVTFIDRYVSPDLTRAFSDAVTEIVVGDGAHVRYASIQDWGRGVTHLGVQRATVGRDAEIRTLAIGFGADLARAEAETILAQPGGFSEMLGIFFADGDQHFDHRSLQDHVAPNCTSDLL
ncbi:MAG: SufB/SufD family protein, partial [Acidimicrobiia bacterium]